MENCPGLQAVQFTQPCSLQFRIIPCLERLCSAKGTSTKASPSSRQAREEQSGTDLINVFQLYKLCWHTCSKIPSGMACIVSDQAETGDIPGRTSRTSQILENLLMNLYRHNMQGFLLFCTACRFHDTACPVLSHRQTKLVAKSSHLEHMEST